MSSTKQDWWKEYCWNRCGINEKYCWNRSGIDEENLAEIEAGLMKRILLNESGTLKINIVFCAELSETNCRAELSTPNCPRRIVLEPAERHGLIWSRRYLRAELSWDLRTRRRTLNSMRAVKGRWWSYSIVKEEMCEKRGRWALSLEPNRISVTVSAPKLPNFLVSVRAVPRVLLST